MEDKEPKQEPVKEQKREIMWQCDYCVWLGSCSGRDNIKCPTYKPKEPKQEQGQDVVEKFTQAIARGWCSKENSGKVGVWERIFFYYYR